MAPRQKISLPLNWHPRPYQKDLWNYLEKGGKRAIAVWHRRAGKDDVCLHWAACAAVRRVGNYWHMLPEAAQARKAIWEAVNPHTGARRIDEAFPAAIRENTRENEMMIRLKNGSTWQVLGSDNYNSYVGSAPVGIVFSEWALADPAAWAYVRPILRENDGWALFISTPRGRNHLATFFRNSRDDPDWFVQKLTARDTPVFSEAELERERAEYMREYGGEAGRNLFEQEYLCSFDAALPGSYYGTLLKNAEDEGRITRVPYDPAVPVHTAWDLGIGDSTAIWFAQMVGKERHIIDYYETSGVALQHYAKLVREKPYVYAAHYLPHDARARELQTGKSRVEALSELGLECTVAERALPVDDGIQAVRTLLPVCWFDAGKCERGLNALRNYQRRWDDRLKDFRRQPLHDWSSHGADAFRELAVQMKASTRPDWDRPLITEVGTIV